MINIKDTGLPRSPVQGMNTKIVGRVKPVSNVKQTVKKTAIEKTAADKQPIERATVEKTAGVLAKVPNLVGSGAQAAVTAAAGVGAIWLANKGISALEKKLDGPAYKSALEKAIQLNPKLGAYPRAKLEEYFALIVDSSPTVAKNPLLVANYLDYLIDAGGQLNYPSYEALTKLEGQAMNNRNNAHPFMNEAIKAYTSGVIKGSFDGKKEYLVGYKDALKGKPNKMD